MRKRPRIGVVGLTGQSAFFSVKTLPRPGETVTCRRLFFEPGGKGHNQAVACARMGAGCVFVGAIGADPWGEACRSALLEAEVRPVLLEKQRPTAFAAITVAQDGENTVQVYPGASAELCPDDLTTGEAAVALGGCQLLLLQNELPKPCLAAAFRLAREHGIPVVWNPAPAQCLGVEQLPPDCVATPNEEEARRLLGLPPDGSLGDEDLAQRLCRAGLRRTVVTLGARGVLVVQGSQWERIPAVDAGQAVDTSGAGDTFNGALAVALAENRMLAAAARFAVTAAGISVTRRGAAGSIPARDEVEILLAKERRTKR